MTAEHPESLLVADIGSVNTKVGLVDRVGNEYRVVGVAASPTTAEPPFSDVMVGLRQAVHLIQARTRRTLLNNDGQLISPEHANGQGVDGFAAVTSAAGALRVAIVGLSREVSVAGAACAARGTYADVVATLAVDETGSRWLRTYTPGNQATGNTIDPAVIAAEQLAQAEADAIILVGGVDGGATHALCELANLIGAIVASRDASARPTIIFGGNREARPQIASRLGQLATLRVVDNVHPSLDRENLAPLQRELEALYVDRKFARLAGLPQLNNWSARPVIPTAQAFDYVVRFLSRRFTLDVLGADVGGTTTVLSSVLANRPLRTVRADLGTGHSAGQVVKQAGAEMLVKWLPFEASAEDVHAFCLNHLLRPGAIPVSRQDARLQQSVVRQALALARKDSGMQDSTTNLMVLTGGTFSFNSDYGALALAALDGLEVSGVFTLAVDGFGIAPALGALATVNADVAASVIERDAFVTLGTVIAPVAADRGGQVNMKVELRPVDAGEVTLEVEHGSLEIVPLASGQKASLQVQGVNAIDLGDGRHGAFKGDIEGGALGLIIDARGRPIVLPPEPEKRRDQVQQWFWDVGS